MKGVSRHSSSSCDSWRRLTILGLLAVAMFGAGYVVATSTGGAGPQASVAALVAPAPVAKPVDAAPVPQVTAVTKEAASPKADKEVAATKSAKKAAVATSSTKSPAASTAKTPTAAPAKAPAARFSPSPAKLGALTSTLQTARSQIELYCLQHQDQYPTLAQLQQDWSALTKPTDADGKVMKAAGRATFGPYLKSPPVNPITNSNKVAAPGQATPETGWTYDDQTGALKAVLPSNVVAPDLDPESVERVAG